MKKSTILKITTALGIVFLGYSNSWGQTLSVNSQTLSQHGSNSAGTVVATENTDSVTIGGVTRYYVVPDAGANPAYTGVLTGTLASTFNWTTSGSTGPTGTIAQVGAVTYGNYRQVTWAGPTGTINLNVVESSGAGCASGTTTTVPVRVIAVPTVTGGAAPTAQCTTTPGTLTFAVPVTLTSDLVVAGVANRVRVNYTITNPDATTLTGATDVDLDKTATSFNVTLTGATQYGSYTVTLNTVSDRISRKSGVNGTISTATIALVVNRVPTTGPIYHLPNN